MDLKKQGLINTIGNIVYLFALWLLTVITTQVLGYEAIGVLTLAMSIGSVVVNIQLFGVRGYQCSDMAFRYASFDYLRARLVTVTVGLLISVGVCILLGYSLSLCVTIFLFLLLRSSEAFSDVFYGNVQRVGRLEFAGYSTFMRGILIVLLFYVGAYFLQSLNIALVISAIGAFLLTSCLDIPFHRRTIKDFGKSTPNSMSIIIKNCIPLFVGAVIPTAIMTIPRIVLERYYGPVVLGFYGNVSTPSLLLSTSIPIILTAVLPIYGQAFIEKDFRSIRRLWIRTIAGTLLMCGVCLLGVFLFGRQLLAFIYTKQILPYVHYLYSILISMLLYAFVICNNTVLVSIRRNQIIAITAAVSFVVCLLISVPLVATYGISGAIAVLLISFGINALIQAICILRFCAE